MALGTAVLLAACGGGGAGGNPNQGGPVSITPNGGTFYAGVPVTFTVQGGRPPYAITSSEPSLLPVPSVVEGHQFTTIPNNPGVVDVGLQPGELPTRTVNITVRDSTGVLTTTQDVRIAQNFLTGYGIAFTPSNCPQDSSVGADPVAEACAGGETAIQMQATFNGNLAGNRQFRFEVVRGNFSIRNPVTGQAGQAVTVTSNHAGMVNAIIEVPLNAPTQLAVLRVVDVATGVYTDTVFTISGRTQGTTLTVLPDEFTFTGALTTQCGTGTAEFMVFDGVAPFTAVSSNANIVVTPTVSTSNPGRFTITASNSGACVNATIVVTDSRGARATVEVTTEAGSTAPTPPAAFAVGPTALAVGCGQSGSVAVVGGTGNYFATSTNPNVTAAASGNTVTITRAGPAGPGSGGTTTVGIGVTDGRSIVTVNATVPVNCP